MNTNVHFDFNRVINRKSTNSVKWDFCECCFDGDDVLPMWVADMDFMAPPQVVDAVRRVADHGIYGYSDMPDSYFQAIGEWVASRHRWAIERSWLSYTPGVITGLNVAIQTFTRPGDRVIIQPPVYPPFYRSIEGNGRVPLLNHLRYENGAYAMDLDHLESLIDARTRMIVLCSPHNPVGRVWSRKELERLGDIACRHDLIIFSDEIHSDLVYAGNRHVPAASIDPEVAARTITGIAPSKTFNVAGLKASVIITPSRKIREEFDRAQENIFGLYNANIFAIAASEAAYRFGAPWLDELLPYLEENVRVTEDFLQNELPEVRAPHPEGTFLMWLDFSRFGMSPTEIHDTLLCAGKIGLNSGTSFGPGGEGFMRLNIGCPRATLTEGLERIRQAFRAKIAETGVRR